LLQAVKPPNRLFLGFRLLDEVMVNNALGDEPEEKDRVWDLQDIHAVPLAAGRGANQRLDASINVRA
jgi:hypothetical protein